jgi:ribosomal-protein-alanine N-acetyltransferase
MGWFGTLTRSPHPVLENERLTLRLPQMADFAAWTALRQASRDFLTPFEPLWPADDFQRSSFQRRVQRHQTESLNGLAYGFLIFRRDDGTLMGGVSLAHVRRGVMQSASVGYWMGAPHAGHGVMSAAVGLIKPFAFGTLGLHRLEAACLPDNVPSIHLLEKAGFKREGYARKYLNIGGSWRDHVLYALLEEDWAKAH